MKPFFHGPMPTSASEMTTSCADSSALFSKGWRAFWKASTKYFLDTSVILGDLKPAGSFRRPNAVTVSAYSGAEYFVEILFMTLTVRS